MRGATGATVEIAAGRLSADDQPGIIVREGMNIDSVQQEPHSPHERLLLFFTVEPGSGPSRAGPMLGRPGPPPNGLPGGSYICRKKCPTP